ncbi:hypothetical protein AJ79_05547 [Helicocarpus griseus UAMH5409]|uniref:Uncharacterized protein n=1 Tax=Helicocarpus griseus UAMH5409 TaxID=1447875 RepID=A0A2B7XMC9_9EURO|nr:hypothetical protein AJ79_05547 [Helicocarpus griseus UAMH5409]
MDGLRTLIARGDGDDHGLSPTTVNLLISLLVLILLGIAIIGGLLVIRRKRQARKVSELPMYNDQCSSTRRLTISASKSDSVYVIDEKRKLSESSLSPPQSPVPEIRITFPEEEDAAGKRRSGRVVVVRISEKGSIGLEPYDEDLPPYQSNGTERFQSLDLDRMGGLKEKADAKRWS